MLSWVDQAGFDAVSAYAVCLILLTRREWAAPPLCPGHRFELSAALRSQLIARIRKSDYFELSDMMSGMSVVYDVWCDFITPERLVRVTLHAVYTDWEVRDKSPDSLTVY
jgi:hypothetical protein